MKLFIFVGMSLGSWAGWWLGGLFSDGIGWPLFLSAMGMFPGTVLGWWVARKMDLT